MTEIVIKDILMSQNITKLFMWHYLASIPCKTEAFWFCKSTGLTVVAWRTRLAFRLTDPMR